MSFHDFLFVIAAVCLAIAIVWGMAGRIYYLFRSKQEPPVYFAVALFSLIGVFGIVFGGECLYDIKTSTTIRAVGVIDHVVLTRGKTDHYWFTFHAQSGAYRLSSDYGGLGLQDDETVDISFLDKPSTLTYLHVLDPPQYGWLVLNEGNGTANAIFMCILGLGAFVVVFITTRHKSIAPIPSEVEPTKLP
jgi:hypothetical protein